MSFLASERIPAKIFRSTDAGAPAFSIGYADCMINILKACLVTGYGAIEGAGWSEPFASAGGVVVLQPELSANTNYQLRLSNDNGKQLTAKVFVGMSDINTGNEKLKLDTDFKYGFDGISSWCLIATSRGVFFTTDGASDLPEPNKRGVLFFCGDTLKGTNSPSGIFLAHSGGTGGMIDRNRYPFWADNTEGSVAPKFYDATNGVVSNVLPSNIFTGSNNSTKSTVLNPFYFFLGGDYYRLPIYGSSRADSINNDMLDSPYGRYIVRGVALSAGYNILVGLDSWEA